MKDNLIISIPTSDRLTVDGHFGHTKEFVLYTVKDNGVISKDFVTPPKHETGVLPRFLADVGANVIITGGMGAMAVNLFKSNNIDVIMGASGTIDKTIESYLTNNLESTGSACEHDHGKC